MASIELAVPDYRPTPVARPWMPRDYASKGWCRPEWADLSAQDIAPRRRTTDRPAEFGPAALTASDRAVLWLSFSASGAAVGAMLFFMLTGGQS